MRDNLVAVPVSLKDAHKYVGHLHRHRKALPDWQSNMQDLVAVGAAKHGKLVGVAILSRPFSRFVADGETIEVSRLCTDGTRNACSFLYAKSARAAEALGFRRVITYILYGDEPGTSLMASGWELTVPHDRQAWHTAARGQGRQAQATMGEALPPGNRVVRQGCSCQSNQGGLRQCGEDS